MCVLAHPDDESLTPNLRLSQTHHTQSAPRYYPYKLTFTALIDLSVKNVLNKVNDDYQRKIHNITDPTEEPALAKWETKLAFKLVKDHPVR